MLGITGASGALYARAILQAMLAAGGEVHLTISPTGQRLIAEELGELLPAPAATGRLVEHSCKDVGAACASGSFLFDGMVVAPCSSQTLCAIAAGLGDNLIHRSAHVSLKERRRLILLHRETPLTLMDIRAMETVTLAGAVVMPASPGFYHQPKSLDDLARFMAERVMDLLGWPAQGAQRWGG